MILATWAILFGQLLNRDYFVKTLDIRESQAIQRGREESFLGIYFKQERIGYVKNRMIGKDEGGEIGRAVQQECRDPSRMPSSA